MSIIFRVAGSEQAKFLSPFYRVGSALFECETIARCDPGRRVSGGLIPHLFGNGPFDIEFEGRFQELGKFGEGFHIALVGSSQGQVERTFQQFPAALFRQPARFVCLVNHFEILIKRKLVQTAEHSARLRLGLSVHRRIHTPKNGLIAENFAGGHPRATLPLVGVPYDFSSWVVVFTMFVHVPAVRSTPPYKPALQLSRQTITPRLPRALGELPSPLGQH